jgi:hypothetical protein
MKQIEEIENYDKKIEDLTREFDRKLRTEGDIDTSLI